MCGHTQRRQQKEAQLNARISQLREEVLQPQSVIEEDQPLPPTANELHITRAMHNEDVDARPLEAEVQFLWKESEIRPQPLMVAPSPMDRIAPPQSNRMLLQHSEVSQPPYAAAEAAKLTAQRHQMSRMEFEEKIQPFRVAKTLLTNTNARHLALLDVQEKRKEREQWLVQRIGAFYPENEEEEEDPADPGATAASGSGSGNERPLPDEDPAGLAQEASQSTSSRGAITSPNVAGSGASTSAPPFRIPKHFPASFRALLEDLHPPSTPESTSRLSRHHRHRHSPHANSHSHSRSRSGGAGPLGSSSSGQLRSISSRAHFPPRFRPGGFGLDGPTIIHHPHLDRLRTALMALTEQEVDAILRPPGWEEFEKQHPKRRSNASPPLRPMSPETPISLRRSQSSQAFEQYRRSLLPSPAASVHGGAGGTAVSEETVDAAVSPEKRRLDEISILFLHLLEEAADAANYGPEERERIIDIHAAFQEQRLQQEYQNYHPVLDVVVSAAFDEQWELEVERHKTEKDRKLEAGIAAASSQQKKVCASAKHNAGAAAGGGKGSHSAGKAKTASRTAGKRGDATSTRPSEADSDSAQAATLAALANASPSLEAFGGFNVNPLFPLDKAWIREIERIRQHDALLDLLRQRPVCPADELPPGLGTEVTGGMQPIASRGSFTNSATSGGIANAIAGGHGGHTGPSPVPGGDASDLPPTSIVTFPQAEMGMLVNPSSSDHAAAAATGTTQRRRSTASPDTVKASVGQAGAAGPAVRKSSISINESMNIVLGDSKEQSAADEERVGRGSISNSSAASGGAAESTSHEANDETQQPQRSAESGAGEVGEDGNQEAEAEAGAQAPSSAPPRSSMASSSDTPHTATAGGSANSQTSGVSPSPEDDEAAGRRGSNTKVGRSVPPPLQLSSPSVVLPANEQELMHHTQLQQSAQQQMLLASSTSMSTYNTSTLNAGVPLMNQTTFNADDAWGSIRDMGMAVPLDIHAPHMELLLDYHESAVAEMELIMEAEERSVTNLLQQL